MRIIATIACVLHFTAVLMTSGVALCVGNDGHAEYEWTGDECCGEPVAEAEPCCEQCEAEEEQGDILKAAPDCGGCVDGLAPMMSGVAVDLHPIGAAPEEIRVAEVVNGNAAGSNFAAGGPLTCGPPVPLPLRC
ncbi:MAG: hypothetical protein AAB074_05255 [Planctomycetota bacterium]